MDDLFCLKKVSLFSSLDDEDLKHIAKIGQKKKFYKGETVCVEGEKGDSMYLVLSGKVKVSLFHEGKEYVLTIIERGGFFGELSLIDGFPRSASVEALEDCDLLVIYRKDFLKLLKENPEISLEIMKALCKRVRTANQRIKDLAFLPVERRILSYLIDYGTKNGISVKDQLLIENGPANAEISSFCGCARETVSRVIKSLEKKGILKKNKRTYLIFPFSLL